jgi:hypothetical protein
MIAAMTIDEFRKSRTEPVGLTAPLRAMWHDANGDWDSAHRIAQDDDSREAAWVHAYLHRREGDDGNAGYWYARAGRSAARGSLETEWQEIVGALMRSSGLGEQ